MEVASIRTHRTYGGPSSHHSQHDQGSPLPLFLPQVAVVFRCHVKDRPAPRLLRHLVACIFARACGGEQSGGTFVCHDILSKGNCHNIIMHGFAYLSPLPLTPLIKRTEQPLLHHKHARGAGPAHQLVPRDEDRVLAAVPHRVRRGVHVHLLLLSGGGMRGYACVRSRVCKGECVSGCVSPPTLR